MLDASKPLETRKLIRQRMRQREVLSYLEEWLIRRALVHPRYNEFDPTIVTRPDVTDRERCIVEAAVRDRAAGILETPEVVEALERMRRGVTGDVVMEVLSVHGLEQTIAYLLKQDARTMQESRVQRLNDDDLGLALDELTELLVFADALAGDYVDPRVSTSIEKYQKYLDRKRTA